jgi:hypothetical protein
VFFSSGHTSLTADLASNTEPGAYQGPFPLGYTKVLESVGTVVSVRTGCGNERSFAVQFWTTRHQLLLEYSLVPLRSDMALQQH